MKDLAKAILKMAATKKCEVRLETSMEHVELKEGEIAIADDGFIIVIRKKRLQVPVEKNS